MIATRSQSSATTARSWLMNRTDMPLAVAQFPEQLRAPRPGRSRPGRWSARRRAAPRRAAPARCAIATRCSCPPDSCEGYLSSRPGDSSTWRIARLAASVASLLDMPCSRSARCTTLPTRNTGLNAVAGLWKIAAIRRPRTSRSSRWDSPVSSVPSSVMLPRTVAPTVCARPSTASVVMDLPDPLSPASPTISAAPTCSSSTSTTRRAPKLTCSPVIASLIAGTSASGRAGPAARHRAG